MNEQSCLNCKHTHKSSEQYPCFVCQSNYTRYWEPAEWVWDKNSKNCRGHYSYIMYGEFGLASTPIGADNASPFGKWKDNEELETVIDRHCAELEWYFREYLPFTRGLIEKG